MLMAVICFTACSNDDNDPQKPINPEQPKAVELNDTTLTFELNADTATVNIGSSEGLVDRRNYDRGRHSETYSRGEAADGRRRSV